MRELLVQKTIGAVLVALAIAILTPFQVAVTYILFGQGHFLAAYYYQWKAGKIGVRGFVVFVVAAAFLFEIARWVDVRWFALATGIIFFMHHFQDEVTLFGKERSFYRGLEILAVVILYGALTADALFPVQSRFMGLAVTALIALIYAGFVFTKRFKPDVLSAYYALILLGLAAIALSGVAIPPEYLVGAVILYHYASWYVHYYVRFAPKPERQRGYLIDMLSVNALIIAAYALYLYVPQLWPLSYAFLPIYFYIWTILHIASSVRFDDYRSMLRF